MFHMVLMVHGNFSPQNVKLRWRYPPLSLLPHVRFCYFNYYVIMCVFFSFSTQKLCGPYVYLLFMTMAIIAFTYTLFRLPETRGRTFDDIAAEFRGAEGIPLHNKTNFHTFSTWMAQQHRQHVAQATPDTVVCRKADGLSLCAVLLQDFGLR